MSISESYRTNMYREDVRIVIIGAGISGIAAAERLISLGFRSVTILEAEGRVGGRIYTRELGKGWIDMGAQWIHGQQSNPVYELACINDLVDVVAQEDSAAKSLYYYLSSGQVIPTSVINETSTLLDNIFNEMTRYSRQGSSVENETVGNYVQTEFYKHLKDDTVEAIKRMKEGLFNWRLIMEKTENACSSIYDMLMSAWGEYVLCAGLDAVELSRGYQPILDLFLRNVPTSCINLNTRVEHIDWSVNSISGDIMTSDSNAVEPHNKTPAPCRVVTSDGRTFEADHVIVTSSLGFLKANAQTMFNPPLPHHKMSAIERLGFGTVNKIYLEFDVPFWKSQCKGIEFVWFPDDKVSLKCLEGLDKEEQDLVDKAGEWYRAVHGFDVVAQHSDKLLCGWLAGQEADRMESLPDHIVSSVCHELLSMFTGIADLPTPMRIIRSAWRTGGLSMGSYSYRRTGSTSRDSYTLAQPLCHPASSSFVTTSPVLMFAGEATHDMYFSTTHGALLSGQREAQRLDEYYTSVCEQMKEVPLASISKSGSLNVDEHAVSENVNYEIQQKLEMLNNTLLKLTCTN